MIAQIAELEIALGRGLEHEYDIELRFTGPEDDADTRRSGSTLSEAALQALNELDPGSEGYGKQLFSSLFSDPEVLSEFRAAMAVTESGGVALRIRLVIDAASPELHRLRWEALRNPDTGARLFTGERNYFSRYISTPVYHPLARRPKSSLSALVALANPSDLANWSPGGRALPPVDVAGEERRIRAALHGISVDVLRRDGEAAGGYVGLQTITDALRAKSHDILYVVCHGTLAEREPRLFLEKPDGTADAVSGVAFAERLTELRSYPRLVVLASCQSAGEGDAGRSTDAGVLAALGPRLAEAGIPAVLAMQGDVTMTTVERFMPAFFSELAESGQIDRAAALARGATRDRPDAWTPVLFMRLKGGGIWYQRSVETAAESFTDWRPLVGEIVGGNCTAILGPGLLDPFVGTRWELARKLAEAYAYPLSPYEREDLPEVAQYAAVEGNKYDVDSEIIARMCDELQSRFRDVLTDEARTVSIRRQSDEKRAYWFDELMRQAWRHRCRSEGTEAHQVLAQLPFATYLSANVDDLMGAALAQQPGRAADVEVFRRKGTTSSLDSLFDRNPRHAPTIDRPLVYHLFGKASVKKSLVTTQDNYFDALIAMAEHGGLPQAVRNALTENPLLFIGFQVDDWSFRVLFRFLMNQEAVASLADFTHVAVQIDPEEQRFENPRAVKRYLAKYLEKRNPVRFSIYWGKAQDFTRELLTHYRAQTGAATTVAGAEPVRRQPATVS